MRCANFTSCLHIGWLCLKMSSWFCLSKLKSAFLDEANNNFKHLMQAKLCLCDNFCEVSKMESLPLSRTSNTHIYIFPLRLTSPRASCIIFSHNPALILTCTFDRPAHHTLDLTCRNLQLQLSSFTVPNNGTEQQCGNVTTCFLIGRWTALPTFYLKISGTKERICFLATFHQCNNFYILFFTTKARHVIIIRIQLVKSIFPLQPSAWVTALKP